MATKIQTGIVSDFVNSIEGNNLVITYRGKEALRLNLKIFAVAYKDLGVYLGDVEGKKKEAESFAGEGTVAFTDAEVQKFINAFQMLQKKYTGKFSSYPKTGRYYTCFEQAVTQAKQNNLEPEDYLRLLINHYSRRNLGGGSRMAFPYPNQLAGEYAQQVIVDETARTEAKEIPEQMRAERLAHTNRYLKLDQDQAFQDAYFRVKAKTATRFDFEYMKARQTQLLGQPKDWLLKREKEFTDKEAELNGNEK